MATHALARIAPALGPSSGGDLVRFVGSNIAAAILVRSGGATAQVESVRHESGVDVVDVRTLSRWRGARTSRGSRPRFAKRHEATGDRREDRLVGSESYRSACVGGCSPCPRTMDWRLPPDATVEGGDERRHAAASLEATESSFRFEDAGQRPAQDHFAASPPRERFTRSSRASATCRASSARPPRRRCPRPTAYLRPRASSHRPRSRPRYRTRRSLPAVPKSTGETLVGRIFPRLAPWPSCFVAVGIPPNRWTSLPRCPCGCAGPTFPSTGPRTRSTTARVPASAHVGRWCAALASLRPAPSRPHSTNRSSCP